MKTYSIASMIILLVLCLSSVSVMGDNDDQAFEMKRFGLGLYMQQFTITDLTNDLFIPANKVLLVLNEENFRTELEFGLFYVNYTEYKMKAKGLHFGGGFFGMRLIEKTNIYYGGRLSFGRMEESNGFEYTSSILAFGPSLGVEYFFSSRFSIGGEINVKFMTMSEDDHVDLFDDHVLSTNTGLILRFYF